MAGDVLTVALDDEATGLLWAITKATSRADLIEEATYRLSGISSLLFVLKNHDAMSGPPREAVAAIETMVDDARGLLLVNTERSSMSRESKAERVARVAAAHAAFDHTAAATIDG